MKMMQKINKENFLDEANTCSFSTMIEMMGKHDIIFIIFSREVPHY